MLLPLLEDAQAEVFAELLEQERALWASQQSSQAEEDARALAAVFEQLELRRLLVRSCFGCCSQCAHTVLMGQAADAGDCIRGYVFFDEQACQDAVEHGQLLLSCGACDGDELALMEEVLSLLKA
ncbi:MAG: hypothetical protein RBU37_05060, partial [Myxococcota bacterium]|nr:hypothetical protein [Myxococcota bacterium]